MYKEELEKRNCVLSFETEEEFAKFLVYMTDKDIWIREMSCRISFAPLVKGTDLRSILGPGTIYSSQDVLDDISATGGIVMRRSCNTSSSEYGPVNLDFAELTLDERAGAKCKLVGTYAANKLFDRYASIVTEGFKFFNNSIIYLVRGGWILAVHSGKYKVFPQQDAFLIAAAHMKKSHPESEFLKAEYTHDRTVASYKVCSCDSDFMKAYGEAWKKAGLPASMLENTYPVLNFSTSDTGRYPIAVTPVLKMTGKKGAASGTFPLGTSLEMKHNSKASPDKLVENAKYAFSNLKEGIMTLQEMLEIELKYPNAVFVKTASIIGITAKAKGVIKEVYMDFKDDFYYADKVTAFDVYKKICEIQLYKSFKDLSEGTKMQILEALYRMLQIDWNKIDHAGAEEI